MKKSRIFLVLFIIFFILAVLGILTYFSERVEKNPPGTVGNTAGNLLNGGLFCPYGGKVYFANPYNENTLYVMNPDETEIEKLTTVGVKSINAAGDYIYFYQDSVGDGSGLGYTVQTTGLYRMTNDGDKFLCLKRDPVATLNVVDNNVVYQHFIDSGMSMDSISIDKETEAVLLEGTATPASAKDGVIYYSNPNDNMYLYAYDTNTGMNMFFWQHKVYHPIYHTDGYIYFIDVETGYELHRYNPSTGEEEVLTTDRVELYNIYENCIFYQTTSANSPALYRLYTDGSAPEIVAYGTYSNINMTSHYAYFTNFGSELPVYKQTLWGAVNVMEFQPGIPE